MQATPTRLRQSWRAITRKRERMRKAIAYLIQAGDGAFRVYAHSEAIAYTSRALDLGRSGVATHEQLQHLYTQRGRAYELSDRYDQALANYEEMQALAQTRRDRPLELEALMACALAHAVSSGVPDWPKVQALSLDALTLAGDLGDRPAEAKIDWILLLANRFGNEGPRRAIEYGERSLALARELGLKEQVAFTLKDLATAYVACGRLSDARATLPEALNLWRELDNKPMLAEVLGGQAAEQWISGEMDQAIRAAEESYSLSQIHPQPLWVVDHRVLCFVVVLRTGPDDHGNPASTGRDRHRRGTRRPRRAVVGSTRRIGLYFRLSGRLRARVRISRARHRVSRSTRVRECLVSKSTARKATFASGRARRGRSVARAVATQVI